MKLPLAVLALALPGAVLVASLAAAAAPKSSRAHQESRSAAAPTRAPAGGPDTLFKSSTFKGLAFRGIGPPATSTPRPVTGLFSQA